jgi:small subunit ribosomal protein S17
MAKPVNESQLVMRPSRKTRVGVVTSNRMTKTIVVRVDRLTRHPLYVRTIKQSTSFKVHDETNEAHIGDLVEIMETRPLSKDKRWRLVKILRRASTAPPVPGEESEQPKPAGKTNHETTESEQPVTRNQ